MALRGFRGFADYRIARVNLLVGTNNSGKTSILEAAQLFLHRVDLHSVLAGPLR